MRTKKAGILTKVIVLALLVYAAATLMNLKGRLEEAKAARTEMQSAVDEQEKENGELQYALDHYEDMDTIEKVARDMGLGMPGEVIIMEKGR